MRKLLLWELIAIFLIGLAAVTAAHFVIERSRTNKVKSLQSESIFASKSEELPQKNVAFEDIKFPKKFFFGTAYSDFQTAGLSPASDWAHDWDKISDAIQKDSIAKKGVSQKPVYPGNANDLFNRYKDDFDLAGEIGIQVHRISLEWARVEPEEGKFDYTVVAKYREMFAYMKKRGIEPMICLNHFPNPQWFTDKGGWENNQAPYYYERYAEFLAKELGAPLQIKWWLTFNEPQFSIIVPYGNGTWPPFKGVKDLQDKEGFARMMHVTSNILDGHRLAYRAIHKVLDPKTSDKVMISFASAPGAFYPFDENSPLDKIADNVFNIIYTLSLDSFVGNTDRDFIGLNYYGRAKLKMHVSLKDYVLSWLTEEKPFAFEWIGPEKNPRGERPKEFYPQGLYELIMKFKDYGLPMVITENGLNDQADKFREEFITIHLKAVHDAIQDGAPVIGYQYWSLADTWEGGDLSFSNFGLISIDRSNDNLKRTLRPSADTYRDIIKYRGIRAELLEKHKELLTSSKQSFILKYDSSVENDICGFGKDNFNKGIVSLTFDDGWAEIYQNAIPMLNQAGMKSTQYINSKPLGSGKQYMTVQDVVNMDMAGHEIASHGIDHKRFTQMTEKEMNYQFTKSRTDLISMGVKSVTTFAYPWGVYNDQTVSASRKNKYMAARTTDFGLNDRMTDPQLLNSFMLENATTIFQIQSWVDEAIVQKKWLIFGAHQIADASYSYYVSPEVLRLTMNYLVREQVPVMTVRDVVSRCYVN